MDLPNKFELFRQHAEISTEMGVEVHHYESVPRKMPRRKKWRLVKKFIKRYGTHQKLAWTEYIPIRSAADVLPKWRSEPIIVRMTAQSKPQRIMFLSTPLHYNESPDTKIETVQSVYQFPKVAVMQAISYELLKDAETFKDVAKYMEDNFWRQAKPLIENQTTVNGFTG